ncbi:MAG: PAS domain-containing protein [Candidatus Omnitrophica bacterium]|nr:PAS domain-containing protein [Candidatus Omnitrophota bacterium]MBU1869109.1 PAS domain-containing protein [Candidatus Omnitrophota bacterium]
MENSKNKFILGKEKKLFPLFRLGMLILLTVALFAVACQLQLIKGRSFVVIVISAYLLAVVIIIWMFMLLRLNRFVLNLEQLESALIKEKDLAKMYLDVAGVILMAINKDQKVTLINQRGCEILGYVKEEILGKNWFDNFIPRDDAENMKKVFNRLLYKEEGLFGYFENYIVTKNGELRIIAWNNKVIRDLLGRAVGTLSSGEDITDRKRAEEKSMRLNMMYSTLTNINKVILRIHDQQKLFDEVCRIAVEVGMFRMAWIGLVNPNTLLVRPVSRFGTGAELFDRIKVSAADIAEGKGPTGVAVREGRYCVVNDIAKDSRMLPWQNEVMERGYRSSAAFPIRLGGRVIGAFNFFAGQPDFFDAEEIELLKELAADISYALEFMEKERKSKQAQETLLERESSFEIVAYETGHLVYDYNVITGLIHWSGAIEEVTGFEKDEFLRVDIKGWEQMVHPEDRGRALALLEEAKKIGDRYHVKYRFRRKDGTYVMIEDKGIFLQDVSERTNRMLGIMRSFNGGQV